MFDGGFVTELQYLFKYYVEIESSPLIFNVITTFRDDDIRCLIDSAAKTTTIPTGDTATKLS